MVLRDISDRQITTLPDAVLTDGNRLPDHAGMKGRAEPIGDQTGKAVREDDSAVVDGQFGDIPDAEVGQPLAVLEFLPSFQIDHGSPPLNPAVQSCNRASEVVGSKRTGGRCVGLRKELGVALGEWLQIVGCFPERRGRTEIERSRCPDLGVFVDDDRPTPTLDGRVIHPLDRLVGHDQDDVLFVAATFNHQRKVAGNDVASLAGQRANPHRSTRLDGIVDDKALTDGELFCPIHCVDVASGRAADAFDGPFGLPSTASCAAVVNSLRVHCIVDCGRSPYACDIISIYHADNRADYKLRDCSF